MYPAFAPPPSDDRPVMEQFEKRSGRALAMPFNQTIKMQSTCFTPRFPFGNHE
jgi:hypothetical protein